MNTKYLLEKTFIFAFILFSQCSFGQTPVWSENFENIATGAKYFNIGSTKILANGGVDGSKCVEVEYERHDNGGTPRYLHKVSIPAAVEYTLSYDIFFDNDWNIGTGGKYHGLVPNNTTSGCKPIEQDGWSARVVFDNREPYLYTYHQNKNYECGEKTRSKTVQLTKDTWYAVSLHLKLNSADNIKDGYVKLYINGELVATQDDREFRSIINNATKITQFYFCTFLGAGPTGNIKSRNHARFDNFGIYPGELIKKTPGTSGSGTQVNTPPTVAVTSPKNNAVFTLGETIDLKATATDNDGSIDRINFKIDDKYHSTDITSEYTGSFTPTEVGTYKIAARAFDNKEAANESFVTITVKPNSCSIINYTNVNNRGWNSAQNITVAFGDQVTFGPQSSTTQGKDVTNWSWVGPNNFSTSNRQFTLQNIQQADSGKYTVTYTDPNGCKSSSEISIITPEVCTITPYVNINKEGWDNVSNITVNVGDEVWFGPKSNSTAGANVPGWSWTGPNNFTFDNRSLLIEDIQINQSGPYKVTFITPTGCTITKVITVSVSTITAVNDFIVESISIYPNPTTSTIYLSIPYDNEEYNIYNIEGKKVLIFKGNIVDVSELKVGNYTVMVKGNRYKFVKK